MNMSRADYAEKKAVRDYLKRKLLPDGYVCDIRFKPGAALRYSKGYGPWEDEYFTLATDSEKIAEYRLLVKLDKELDEGRAHQRELERAEMEVKINSLLGSYSPEDLDMTI